MLWSRHGIWGSLPLKSGRRVAYLLASPFPYWAIFFCPMTWPPLWWGKN